MLARSEEELRILRGEQEVDEERLQLESTEDDSDPGSMSDDGTEPIDQEVLRNTLRRGSLASHTKQQQQKQQQEQQEQPPSSRAQVTTVGGPLILKNLLCNLTHSSDGRVRKPFNLQHLCLFECSHAPLGWLTIVLHEAAWSCPPQIFDVCRLCRRHTHCDVSMYWKGLVVKNMAIQREHCCQHGPGERPIALTMPCHLLAAV
jgi:hypothetical protein